MANDRIYLRCKQCGAQVSIMSYWPDILDMGIAVEKLEAINTFINAHFYECPAAEDDFLFPSTLNGDPRFVLVAGSGEADNYAAP